MTATICSISASRGTDAAEWEARVQLAAAFRIANRLGWNEGIANHFSMVIPGQPDRFLLNPRELHFSEVTASNLLVVDGDGNKLSGEGQVRAVAFNLHGRLHRAVPHAKCILHAHPPHSTAISCVKGGRLGAAHGIGMMLTNKVCYDDDMNGPIDEDEAARLIRLVGSDKQVVFHSMHGLSTLAESVADAYDLFYFTERMAMYTVLARQMGGPLHELPQAALARNPDRDPGLEPSAPVVHFNAMMRLLDRDEADYKA